MLSKKHLVSICLGAMALIMPISGFSTEENNQCSKEMLMSYFPESFVAKTLEKFKVPQAQRSAIIKELSTKDREVVPKVEERAGKMTPNPLKDPKMRQESVKIFRDTLYELFSGVMNTHGVTDKDQIQSMLDDLQQQKAKQFAACIELHKKQVQDESSNTPNMQMPNQPKKNPSSDNHAN